MGLAVLALAFTQPRKSKSRRQLAVVGWGSGFAGLVQLTAPLIFKS
jgi:hypothetical protein